MARRFIFILKQLRTRSPSRSVTYMPRPRDGAPRAITLISGDRIGPMVTSVVKQVMKAMHAPVFFDRYQVQGDMKNASPKVIESIRKNKVCLKEGLGFLNLTDRSLAFGSSSLHLDYLIGSTTTPAMPLVYQ
ncbi:hypothetical protein ACSBR1_017617 [Camellia fascicularis]